MRKFSSEEWSGIIGLLLAFLFTIYVITSKWTSPWEVMK
jgi:hypothetical protein